MSTATKKESPLQYLHWVIGVAIMYFGSMITPSEPLTEMGVKILAIFVGMIYLWCTVNPIGGSLLAIVAISLTGYTTFTEALSTAIGNSDWLVVFFACILFMSAIESGMPKYITKGIFQMTQGFVTGRPMVLLFVIMVSAYILSGLTTIIPTILMFWAICYAIIDDLKLDKHDDYSMILIVGSFMGALLGNSVLPFKGATVIIMSAFTTASGMDIPYGIYIFINLLCSLIIMVLYCMLCKVLRLDLSKVKDIDGKLLSTEELLPMSRSVKAHLIASTLFIVLVLINGFLPKDSAINVFLGSFGVAGIAILMLIMLFIVRENGKSVVHMGKVMGSMPWGAIFMVLAAVYIAGILKDKETTGIMPWLRSVLNPVLGGHSEIIFAILMFILAMVLTCFFHNGALGNMLMPVMFAVADTNGYDSVAIAVVMIMAINVAFLAPSASNYAPMLHGNKEYVSIKDIWTYGLAFEILAFVVFLAIGFPLAKILM